MGRGIANADNIIPTANSGDLISFLSQNGYCYCCELYTNDPAGDDPRFTSVVTSNVTIEPTEAALIDPIMPGALASDGDGFGNRVCFQSQTSFQAGIIDFTTRLAMAFGDGTESATNVKVRCEETTLFGKFNTSVTDFNFLEILNTAGNSQVTVLMDIFNSVTSTSVVNDQEITIGPNGRKDIDIHSLTGAGAFGTITLCPLAPSKAISAELNQYNIETTSPLVFTPVSKEVFVDRN